MSYINDFENNTLSVSYTKNPNSTIMSIRKNTIDYPIIKTNTVVEGEDGIGTKIINNIGDSINGILENSIYKIPELANNSWNNHIVPGANKTWDKITELINIIFGVVDDIEDKPPAPNEPVSPIKTVSDFNPVDKINELESKFVELSILANQYLSNYDSRVISDPLYNNQYDVDALKKKLKRKVIEAL